MLKTRKGPSPILSTLLCLTLSSQFAFGQMANPSEQLRSLVTTKSFLRAGSAFFETDDIAKFYALRNNQPVWTENGAVTPFATALKQAIMTLSMKHGLIASDYWTQDLEDYYNSLNTQTAVAFELAATASFLLLGEHLSDGRIDPNFIDNDVRFKRRVFGDHTVMA